MFMFMHVHLISALKINCWPCFEGVFVVISWALIDFITMHIELTKLNVREGEGHSEIASELPFQELYI